MNKCLQDFTDNIIFHLQASQIFLTTSSLLFFAYESYFFERHKVCRMLGATYLGVFQVAKYSILVLFCYFFTKNMIKPKILANTDLLCTESTIIYFKVIMHNAMVLVCLLSH